MTKVMADKEKRTSAVHLNGNLLVAIDVETTGLDPALHDIIQIACIPLDYKCEPVKGVLPFYTMMQPRPDRLANIDPQAKYAHKIDWAKMMREACSCWTAADRFVEWVDDLKHRHHILPEDKKLVPLASNWPFDRSFIIDWLGLPSYNICFFGHYRDLMAACLFLNDWAHWHTEPIPFTRLGLGDICRFLNVENHMAHDALHDSYATAECYRKLLYTGMCGVKFAAPLAETKDGPIAISN